MFVLLIALAGAYALYRSSQSRGDSSSGPASPTTSATLAADLAELPRDVRDYVMSFVVDPSSSYHDFESGADALEQGCRGASVGEMTYASNSTYSYQAPTLQTAEQQLTPITTNSVSLNSYPTQMQISPTASSSPALGSMQLASPSASTSSTPSSTSSSPSPTSPPSSASTSAKTTPIPMSTWCYPRAARRLRVIAAEKRAGLGGAVVAAGLGTRTASVSGTAPRSCESRRGGRMWTCCQCGRLRGNMTTECTSCDHRRCG